MRACEKTIKMLKRVKKQKDRKRYSDLLERGVLLILVVWNNDANCIIARHYFWEFAIPLFEISKIL